MQRGWQSLAKALLSRLCALAPLPEIVVIITALLLISSAACKKNSPGRNRFDEIHFPNTVLWAWERPEDLKKLDTSRFAVAFLAQTLVLKNDEVIFSPRHQPLDVSPETKLMAVTRIESEKTTGQRAALNNAQRQKTLSLILKTIEIRNVSAVQIDFDAASSERDFYRSLLKELRQNLPESVPLSITALASFCVGDRWLDDLPVDEAVPMIFRMGADDKTIKSLLKNREDFGEPLCRKSYGVALDEPLDAKLEPSRRRYVFNSHSWTEAEISSLK